MQHSEVIPFDPVKQRELDRLLDSNREGTIHPEERSRLGALVAEAEELMVANALRKFESQRQREGST
jgi:hypothetical protein